MTVLTPPVLWRILETAAGPAEPGAAGGPMLDATFETLGYDSLAILQLAVGIELECGFVIDEEELPRLRTPRAVLELVNSAPPARRG